LIHSVLLSLEVLEAETIRELQRFWSNGIVGWEDLVVVLSIIVVLIIILMAITSPVILRQLMIYFRARRDYRLARGTQHLKQIRISRRTLNIKIRDCEDEKRKLKNTIKEIKQERSKKLLNALSRHIIETRLADIEGIGPVLQNRIINHCFDGTVGSLRRAHIVNGIGHEKLKAISNWVDIVEKYEIPNLIKKDFPNKQRINDEHDQKELELNKRLGDIDAKIAAMKRIEKLASAEISRLSSCLTYSSTYSSFLTASSRPSALEKPA